MFLVNSRLGLFTATCFRRRLLSRSYEPNLPSSLTTLLPLVLGFSPHLPVSVCGTGTLVFTRAFLASRHHGLPYYISVPYGRGYQRPASAILKCPSGLNVGGYGISTVCASTTPFGLALAPGLPVADEPTHGNLRFSAITILTQFSLLIPAFSLEYSPHVLTIMLHPVFNAPLPSFNTA